MQIENMLSTNGNKVANQFRVFHDEPVTIAGHKLDGCVVFQSYDTMIAVKPHDGQPTMLDTEAWDYSVTTSKYRNQFLRETKKETQRKIDSGEYLLCNLNR